VSGLRIACVADPDLGALALHAGHTFEGFVLGRLVSIGGLATEEVPAGQPGGTAIRPAECHPYDNPNFRVDDRNIFIAECKFWHGPKTFEEAIDELLGYHTWRDCKGSLIIFNKQKNTSEVASKMHETMTSRNGHRKSSSHDANGNGRYVFVEELDPGRVDRSSATSRGCKAEPLNLKPVCLPRLIRS
jgi:hypothetical protein